MVYALLPDRKTTTYIYLFNILFAEAKKFDKTFDPSLIMTDFEAGIAKAITLEVQLFPHLSSLSGTISHLLIYSFRRELFRRDVSSISTRQCSDTPRHTAYQRLI